MKSENWLSRLGFVSFVLAAIFSQVFMLLFATAVYSTAVAWSLIDTIIMTIISLLVACLLVILWKTILWIKDGGKWFRAYPSTYRSFLIVLIPCLICIITMLFTLEPLRSLDDIFIDLNLDDLDLDLDI